MTKITPIPLTEINTTSLTRDRTSLNPDSLDELRTSILKHGLRMPIEIYRFEHDQTPKYGLISGLRRLTAFQQLADLELKAFASIPAFIREPQSIAEAMTSMVEENEIRATLSPYERGRIAVEAVYAQAFTTTDQAIDTLYASCTPQKRSRLRAMAELAEHLDGCLCAPETLSFARGIRIMNACRMGHMDAIRDTLRAQHVKGPEADWNAVLPYIEAAEDELKHPDAPRHQDYKDRRKRNIVHLYKGKITIRKQKIEDGFALRITGEYGMRDVVDMMIDDLERLHGEI